jgi:alanine racemase
MGYVDPRDIPRRRHFIYAVSDLDYALALIRQFSRVRLHLFLDSGMHREGIQDVVSTYAQSVLTKIAKHVEGCMSHLSTPDNHEATEMQCETFDRQLSLLSGLGIRPMYTHIFASGGLIHYDAHQSHTSKTSNIARCGIAFYGYGHSELQPALRLTTRLTQIKHIKKGESVGYDRTFTAEKDMKIGVLPIGYHDGMDRRLSSVGMVMI